MLITEPRGLSSLKCGLILAIHCTLPDDMIFTERKNDPILDASSSGWPRWNETAVRRVMKPCLPTYGKPTILKQPWACTASPQLGLQSETPEFDEVLPQLRRGFTQPEWLSRSQGTVKIQDPFLQRDCHLSVVLTCCLPRSSIPHCSAPSLVKLAQQPINWFRQHFLCTPNLCDTEPHH